MLLSTLKMLLLLLSTKKMFLSSPQKILPQLRQLFLQQFQTELLEGKFFGMSLFCICFVLIFFSNECSRLAFLLGEGTSSSNKAGSKIKKERSNKEIDSKEAEPELRLYNYKLCMNWDVMPMYELRWDLAMYELRCELMYCLCPTYVSSCSVVMLIFFPVYELIWSAAMLNFLFVYLCINLVCSIFSWPWG